MKKYITISTIVSAEPWDGIQTYGGRIVETWCTVGSVNLIRGLLLRKDGIRQVITLGDWIVDFPEQGLIGFQPQIFRERFDLI